jgi:hypothetical protein
MGLSAGIFYIFVILAVSFLFAILLITRVFSDCSDSMAATVLAVARARASAAIARSIAAMARAIAVLEGARATLAIPIAPSTEETSIKVSARVFDMVAIKERRNETSCCDDHIATLEILYNT